MTNLNRRYVIITPARDEAAMLPLTIDSIARQSIRPVEWIIVNDGSTDRTGAVIDDAAARFPWLRAVHRSNRGFRRPGGGVVEAFNEGYSTLLSTDWDFIVKLDGDLSFEHDYFEKCFDYFEREPRLGIGGGTIRTQACGPWTRRRGQLLLDGRAGRMESGSLSS